MINRGQVLSEQFLLPSQQGTGGAVSRQPTSQQMATPDSKYFGVPEAMTGLQVTGDLYEQSKLYYDKLSKLDQFAKGMWLNNRIDVTRPDYSRPEAVAAAQAFQQELANTQALGNELQQGAKIDQLYQTQAAAGEYMYNPETQGRMSTARMTQPQIGHSTSFDPAFEQAAKQYSGGRETTNILNSEQGEFSAKMAAYEAQAAQLEAQGDQYGADNIRRQIGKATLAQNAYLNPPAPRQEYGTGDIATGGLITDLVDIFGGGHASYQPIDEFKGNFRIYESTNNAALNNVPSDTFKYGKARAFRKIGDEVVVVSTDDRDEPVSVAQMNIYPILQQHMQSQGLAKEFKNWTDNQVKAGRLKVDDGKLVMDAANLMSQSGLVNRANYTSEADYTKAVKEYEKKAKKEIAEALKTDTFGDKVGRWITNLTATLTNSPFTKSAPIRERDYESTTRPGFKVRLKSSEKEGKQVVTISLIDDAGRQHKDDRGNKVQQVFDSEQDALNYMKELGVGNDEILKLGQQSSNFDPDI